MDKGALPKFATSSNFASTSGKSCTFFIPSKPSIPRLSASSLSSLMFILFTSFLTTSSASSSATTACSASCSYTVLGARDAGSWAGNFFSLASWGSFLAAIASAKRSSRRFCGTCNSRRAHSRWNSFSTPGTSVSWTSAPTSSCCWARSACFLSSRSFLRFSTQADGMRGNVSLAWVDFTLRLLLALPNRASSACLAASSSRLAISSRVGGGTSSRASVVERTARWSPASSNFFSTSAVICCISTRFT
mmetsp:Transcript_93060/g.221280  ORF Transcript_93060/g.221280 Transcript_93060/m.221280 type:complete len:248 (-) Transcript_93060:2223-2966(-)